jgi:hypothetical protein
MKTRLNYRWMILLVVILACDMTAPATVPAQQPTNTAPPTQSPSIPTPTSNLGTGPQCTVLQDLNLRFGPGTAYRPPVKVLPAGIVVVPSGYSAQGIPSGKWVYVQDLATQEKGWVNAGAQYVSCNTELTTLPSVAYGTPPPPPAPKSVLTSVPDGNCGDTYECDVVFTDESFIQFRVVQNGVELTQDEGVEQVEFVVTTLDDTELYRLVERSAAYCIFGGNGPCTPWAYEDFTYKWGAGGIVAEPGEYHVEIQATVNGEGLRWAADFSVAFP